MEILIILTLAVFGLMLYLILKRSAGVDDDDMPDEVSDVFLSEGEVPTELADEPPTETEREPRDATTDDDLWSDDSLHLD